MEYGLIYDIKYAILEISLITDSKNRSYATKEDLRNGYIVSKCYVIEHPSDSNKRKYGVIFPYLTEYDAYVKRNKLSNIPNAYVDMVYNNYTEPKLLCMEKNHILFKDNPELENKFQHFETKIMKKLSNLEESNQNIKLLKR